jgi:hypothetical protein
MDHSGSMAVSSSALVLGTITAGEDTAITAAGAAITAVGRAVMAVGPAAVATSGVVSTVVAAATTAVLVITAAAPTVATTAVVDPTAADGAKDHSPGTRTAALLGCRFVWDHFRITWYLRLAVQHFLKRWSHAHATSAVPVIRRKERRAGAGDA